MKTNSSLSTYLSLSEVGRAVAYYIFRQKKTDRKAIEEWFGSEKAKIGLEDISRTPSLVKFDKERGTYEASRNLKSALMTLRNFY